MADAALSTEARECAQRRRSDRLLCDIVQTSTGKAELLDVVNDQLREFGLELTPTARH